MIEAIANAKTAPMGRELGFADCAPTSETTVMTVAFRKSGTERRDDEAGPSCTPKSNYLFARSVNRDSFRIDPLFVSPLRQRRQLSADVFEFNLGRTGRKIRPEDHYMRGRTENGAKSTFSIAHPPGFAKSPHSISSTF